MAARALIAAALLASATPALAQQAAPPTVAVGMVAEPCPPQPPPSADLLALVASVLGPGPMDPAVIGKTLDPEAVAARTKAEASQRERDWPNLCKYRAQNAALLQDGRRPDVVFIGDSLTELWQADDPALFSDAVVGRGISGQTSPQILLRFYADVVALRPKVVHILAGTNDVAGNTGPTTVRDYQNNIAAMVDIAQVNDIKVVLGSLTPSADFNWRPGLKPAPTIQKLNGWLETFARQRKITFVNYHQALAAPGGAFKASLSNEGTHANSAGYALMRPLVVAALKANGVAVVSEAATGPVASAPGAGAAPRAFTLDTPIATIAADPAGKAILDKDLPGLTTHPMYGLFKGRSLKQVQPMSGGAITDERLAKAQADLADLAKAH
jgi:lysophospholipase L1-like esterase